MSILSKIFGSYNDKKLRQLQPLVDSVANFEANLQSISDEELKGYTAKFKSRLETGESLDDILIEAFAVVRETAKRTLNQRHFDVQILGGIVLHQGGVAEMKTGEGKTLVATLPVYLNALSGKGVHVVTVNDYLARRDSVLMGQIYSFLGLSVGVLNHDSSFIYDPAHTKDLDDVRDLEGGYKVVYEFLKPCSRQEAYQADITYGTNNEFGFDYLRDNITHDSKGLVQRVDQEGKYNFAIIDEVDSILIDESRTPLIISGPSGKPQDLYQTCNNVARQLIKDVDYTVDFKLKAISLTEEGINKSENLLGVDNIYTDKGVAYVHHLETAVRAKALYEKDKDYVVKDGEIIIVDEFTGRLQPGRRWSEGLHQAIEAKEGVDIKEESKTYATVTLQNYFRLYRKLAGMTGTAMTSAEEFMKVYGLETLSIPTNKPNARQDLSDFIFQTEKGKFQALAKQVKELQTKGQPVLIGTVSIEKNELLSAYLKQAGIKHQLLNAKNHEQEGLIIADAGKKGSVTVATNMAGRGIDIKLGGAQASTEEYEEVKSLGGLCVIGTERHEARRIDNQLRGRSGRQGDPGTTRFFVSLEDQLMRVFAPDRIKGMMGRLGIPEDEPIEHKMVSRAIETAQTKIEGLNFDMRKHLLEYDDVVNHQRITLYKKRRQLLIGEIEELNDFLNKALDELELSPEETKDWWDKYQQKINELGADNFNNLVRRVCLQIIDSLWMEHLEAIDYMRSSVRLRAYGQRDPLVEFKKEGLRLFKDLEYSIFDQIIKVIPNIGGEVKLAEVKPTEEIHQSVRVDQTNSDANKEIGRNDLCPCGSGKKYKKCHGK